MIATLPRVAFVMDVGVVCLFLAVRESWANYGYLGAFEACCAWARLEIGHASGIFLG